MSEAELPQPQTLKADRAATSRMCVVTRAVRPVSALIRFVAAPDSTVVPDIRSRLPGRGVWVSANRAAIEQAVARRLLPRALKSELLVPADLAARTERLLAQDALQALSLANKAGAVVTGFAKIEGMGGVIAALVQARDGSPAEIRRLQGLMHARGRGGRDPAVIRCFSGEELALSLGRELVIHAALRPLDAGALFEARVRRLEEFRVGDPIAGEALPADSVVQALDYSRS